MELSQRDSIDIFCNFVLLAFLPHENLFVINSLAEFLLE